jgi:hypothetical protein
MNILRRGSHQQPAPPRGPVHVWTRRARIEGRELMRIHCFEAQNEFLVLCDVFPSQADETRSVKAGPYVFPSRHEAAEFADEAGVVLEHLGCELAHA